MHTIFHPTLATVALLGGTLLAPDARAAGGVEGYYRQPTIRGDVVVFVSEGDLWKVSLQAAMGDGGATATRLTSHAGDESNPRFSPDGSMIAFTAQYEGPTEAYVMPSRGGLPTRLTWDGSRTTTIGWTPADEKGASRIIASTNRFSTLPNIQLALIEPATGAKELLPLAQASDGAFGPDGRTLYFTRIPFNGSFTKRYKGGTIQQLWKFDCSKSEEATGLTTDFPGTSCNPMWWNGRVYHLSDRDQTMELWSMNAEGKDLTRHTDHASLGVPYLDVKGPSLDQGRIVYQLGADLWCLDLSKPSPAKLRITLDSDFDQTRERWVKKPFDYVTASHVSHDGEKVAITARGQIFVAPKGQGRLVEVPRAKAARQRDARFMPDGSILTISDETGETELWTLPADGVDVATKARQVTADSTVLRFEGVPSPDGTRIASIDKDQRLWLVDVAGKTSRLIDTDEIDLPGDLAWSADGKWLAYTLRASNQNRTVKLFDVEKGVATAVTTDRFESYSPAWSPDGKWLYFLSDRSLLSTVSSPWGPMAPEPHFDKTTKAYALALTPGERWPFAPDDEVAAAKKAAEKREPEKKEPAGVDAAKPEGKPDGKPEGKPDGKPDAKADGDGKPGEKGPKPIKIELDGIVARLFEVPMPAGNYVSLSVQEKRLLALSVQEGEEGKNTLHSFPIANKDLEFKTVASDIASYEISGDGKWMLLRRPAALHVAEATAATVTLDAKNQVNLAGWTFPITPREEWRRMFVEAWRLERDYFWDSNMHGVDWKGMLERYMPLADRVSTRAELNDVISQMVGELSALHIFVRGGDLRAGETDVAPATLGGLLVRDEAGGGWRVDRVYRSDPDEPSRRSPLAAPGVEMAAGDVILEVNGRPTLGVPDIASLLRGQAGRQVLLVVRPGAGGDARRVIVTPMSIAAEEDLRYHEWEYTRRERVEREGGGDLGYVHLRAMGTENFTEFAKGFYPNYGRKGLIIDVRHNRGGNIDSWILSRLLRKAWFYWSPDVGRPYWNMQYAFRGHVVVLCNERTASDGEAFAEGIKRLKIGTVIGTRTWGGEIWLSSSNFLVDKGIATAAETGVYGPEGEWLIEGHGVEPDIVVDNLPHATFKGEDAQLKAAIELLRKKIKEEPVEVPPVPKRPDKSHREPAPK
ncbi:MAG: S41 family peptidase [Phycisphaerae bacterium]